VQPKGLQVAFGSTHESYLRCEVPAAARLSRNWQASGWRGERVNAQILAWAADPQEQVRFSVSDLKADRGSVIRREQVKLKLVRYVLSNFPYQATNFTCEVSYTQGFLLPDRLEPFDRFDLPGRSVRPVWLSVDIPANAVPGSYEGTLAVRSSGEDIRLPIQLTVQQQVLPKPNQWQFRLDLWQNPSVLASYFQVEPWSPAHKTLLGDHLKLYAEAGGTFITTYAVHSPWSDNSFVLEDTMIEWMKTANGSWKFDYSIFDSYVQLAMAAGVDRAITIYTPIPWGHRFRYLDQSAGNYVYAKWPPTSPEFRSVWKVFLDDLRVHLKRKGWLHITYLGINENPLEMTLAAAKFIKSHSRDWKITYAGDWHPELSDLVDDYSVIITKEPRPEELRQRRRVGSTTTFYVCCNPPQPNNFVFSAPVEGSFLGWYAAGYGYDGFLRWAYDAWPADPMRDARHTLWPAGDCFLVYPGGASSIRFEKLREGIVDYEKLGLLRRAAARSTNHQARSLMSRLDLHVARLAGERDPSKRNFDPARVQQALDDGRQLMSELSQALAR
jgi:hypothetical protein